MQTIFKEVKKLDNSKSFSEKDRKTSDHNTFNDNLINDVENDELRDSSENKLNLIVENFNIDNGDNNKTNKIKNDPISNKKDIGFDVAISNKKNFIGK